MRGRNRRRRVGWVPRIKYLDRPSPVQRLNPLPKLVTLVGVTVAVFLLRWTLDSSECRGRTRGLREF